MADFGEATLWLTNKLKTNLLVYRSPVHSTPLESKYYKFEQKGRHLETHYYHY